jgi:hypothetical protein
MMNQKEQLEKIAYEQMCQQFELKPEWLGKTFTDRGETYTIVGLNIRSKRFPVVTTVVRSTSGQSYTCRPAWNATHIIGLMTGKPTEVHAEANAKRLAQERANWSMAGAFGLKSEWLDKTFTFRNSPVTIVGLAPTRRRYPVVGKNKWGDIAYYPLETVLKSFTTSAAA